jgi:hypothetical protein
VSVPRIGNVVDVYRGASVDVLVATDHGAGSPRRFTVLAINREAATVAVIGREVTLRLAREIASDAADSAPEVTAACVCPFPRTECPACEVMCDACAAAEKAAPEGTATPTKGTTT